MFKIYHETFAYVTNDKDVTIERLRQGYYVERIEYLRQETGEPVKLVNYGDGLYCLSY